MLDLIDLIKTLQEEDHEKIGFAISYTDIFNTLKVKGFDNKDLLDFELRKLRDDGAIELFFMDSFDEDLIYAVKVK